VKQERDPREFFDRIAIDALHFWRQPELEIALPEIQLHVVAQASIIEIGRALWIHLIEQGRITIHQAAPAEQLGALPDPRTRDSCSGSKAQAVDRCRLARLK